MSKPVYYQITEIPDPFQSAVAQRYGDLRKAIFGGWASLVRMVSELDTESLTLSLCFYYHPGVENGVQGRLRLWIKADKVTSSRKEAVKSIIENGPIAEFYHPLEIEGAPPQIPWKEFKAASEVIRRLEKISSYVGKKENDRILEHYFTLKAFQANDGNDYMALDRQFSGLKKPVYVEISIAPIRAGEEISYIYSYISRLSRINETDFREARNLKEEMRVSRGFRKDHLAEGILREQEELVDTLRLPQLEFSIRVMADCRENSLLIASTLAESALQEGKYRILTCSKGDTNFEELEKNIKGSEIDHSWQHDEEIKEKMGRLTRLATVEELSGIYRLPVGSAVSPRTIRKATDPRPQLIFAAKALEKNEENSKVLDRRTVLIGDDMETGIVPERDYSKGITDLFDVPSTSTVEHRLTLGGLKKHLFISGVPGSGKTTAMFNLLVQLHRKNIPFFVIEPAKTEYRMLKMLKHHQDPEVRALGEELVIFTPGNENLSPLRFNPLAYPKGISLDEHINGLMNCFKAAMPMDGPLPALIAKAVEIVYQRNETPYLLDLVTAVKEVMEETKYDAEIRGNLETAIEVRLSPLVRRSMGKVFEKTAKETDLGELMQRPVVVEMDSIDQEQANLLTLFLLTAVREQIKISRRSGAPLTHVIVLEEAHNIVGRVPESADATDPREKASGYVSRMLAEIRALGEGMIIADQLPSAVAPAVVKNTGTKLAHRLTSEDDRKELGATMLAGPLEFEEMARLQVGEAFYYSEGLYRCRRVRCINSHAFLGLDQPPDQATLYRELLPEPWFRPTALAHLEEDINNWFYNLKDILLPEIENLKDRLLDLPKDAGRLDEARKIAAKISGMIYELDEIFKMNSAIEETSSRIKLLKAGPDYEKLQEGVEEFSEKLWKEIGYLSKKVKNEIKKDER